MKSCQFYFLNISKPFSSDVTTQPNPAFILSGTNTKHPGFPIGTLITSHPFSKPLPKDLLCQLFILLPTCATHTYISLCFKRFNGLQALRGKKNLSKALVSLSSLTLFPTLYTQVPWISSFSESTKLPVTLGTLSVHVLRKPSLTLLTPSPNKQVMLQLSAQMLLSQWNYPWSPEVGQDPCYVFSWQPVPLSHSIYPSLQFYNYFNNYLSVSILIVSDSPVRLQAPWSQKTYLLCHHCISSFQHKAQHRVGSW